MADFNPENDVLFEDFGTVEETDIGVSIRRYGEKGQVKLAIQRSGIRKDVPYTRALGRLTEKESLALIAFLQENLAEIQAGFANAQPVKE